MQAGTALRSAALTAMHTHTRRRGPRAMDLASRISHSRAILPHYVAFACAAARGHVSERQRVRMPANNVRSAYVSGEWHDAPDVYRAMRTGDIYVATMFGGVRCPAVIACADGWRVTLPDGGVITIPAGDDRG